MWALLMACPFPCGPAIIPEAYCPCSSCACAARRSAHKEAADAAPGAVCRRRAGRHTGGRPRTLGAAKATTDLWRGSTGNHALEGAHGKAHMCAEPVANMCARPVAGIAARLGLLGRRMSWLRLRSRGRLRRRRPRSKVLVERVELVLHSTPALLSGAPSADCVATTPLDFVVPGEGTRAGARPGDAAPCACSGSPLAR